MAFPHPHIHLTSVRLDLVADPTFPKSRHARRLQKLGGKFSECRGYSSQRFVTVPISTSEGIELLHELMKLPQARPLGGGSEKGVLVFQVTADFSSRQGYSPRRPTPSVFYFKQGAPALAALETATKVLVEWAEAEIEASAGKLGWAGDERIEEQNKADELRWQRETVESLRAGLAEAESKLARMENEAAVAELRKNIPSL